MTTIDQETIAAVEATPESLADEPIAVAATVEPTTISNAAAQVRERLALHGFELADEVQLAEVPGHVLDALLSAMPPTPGPRPTAEELRGELAERLARSHRLPRGVRERLAGMLETIRFDDTGRDEPALRVSDAVALLEESLPAHVLLADDDLEAAVHPRGDSFFTGDPRSLSDDDARRIAADQLARSGLRRR
jgi:hypothetical protein